MCPRKLCAPNVPQMCHNCAQTKFSLVCPDIVPQLCPNCFCLNCASAVLRLCPKYLHAPTVPESFHFCALLDYQAAEFLLIPLILAHV